MTNNQTKKTYHQINSNRSLENKPWTKLIAEDSSTDNGKKWFDLLWIDWDAFYYDSDIKGCFLVAVRLVR